MWALVLACSLLALPSVHSADGCAGASYLDPLPPPSYSDVLFPLPSSFSFGAETYSISQNFSFSSPTNSTILEQAFTRYSNLIFTNSIAVSAPKSGKSATLKFAHPSYEAKFGNAAEALTVLESLHVLVTSSDDSLQYGVDESYTLNITAPEAVLTAATVFGALRGLETFSQLVTANTSFSGLTISGAPWIIRDAPRYMHRGLLIDTSRHYLNVTTILRAIDALSYSKMNVLHWHLTDAQSFPLITQSFPNLANGRFSQNEIYTADDLKGIVDYAMLRGVRVIVELDSPGHVASWGVGYPEITVCRDKTREQGFCAENPCGQLDPSVPLTFEILQALVQELTQIFPDNFFHFGADEVVYGCWNTSQILSWMQQEKLADFGAVFNYYEQQLHALGTKFSRTPVNWQEVFDENLQLPSNIIVQVWKDFKTLDAVVKAGHKAILSNFNAWYLDCGFANWCSYCSWLDAYQNDPLSKSTLTPEEQALILGGETCIWGELVTDRNFDSRVWPRAAAVGERLWSPQNVTNVPDAYSRLLRHTCRLAERGIDADALGPGSTPYSCINIQQ
eukprot:Phypoly_transcript_06240.p1 GENE.Phypoly_transcript_06240~~Phypoly_transcript_06240.p1  ORF type:complete len:563 (+),score=57.06 Phypoly_transcript_06240:67-1755(+)